MVSIKRATLSLSVIACISLTDTSAISSSAEERSPTTEECPFEEAETKVNFMKLAEAAEEEYVKDLPSLHKSIARQLGARMFLVKAQQDICLMWLKKTPDLSDAQVKWITAIDDLYEDAFRLLDEARRGVILSSGTRDKKLGDQLFEQALATGSKARAAYNKATRDMKTLVTRIEVQVRKK